ncbi:LacI family DNA-binding transcriptional regulator [Pseudoalteromonas piscicida]|uniref:LacI family transcriptional regulator n=1 Tax=Pseudoalteromonas piscicida TaxID=43662 RepID=A0A2A5JL61_PSEO7|nr:LacI family DNA-binding transcriptional regulator [Pseudoalteromonas piscicida]PCK30168.1 LacI family transcriptional regulator [Pseudoalteromonas piscicida]
MQNDKKLAKVTIFDVAREAQVSKSTVSLVLTHSDKVSDKSKDKVLKAIEKLGYVYNRDAAALRSKKSNLVALVINDLTNPFSAQLAVGLEQHVYALGMVPMLVNTGEDFERQRQVVNTLKEYNVAAFIMIPAPNTPREWLDQLSDSGFPVITMMREVAFAKAPCILPDNKKGTHLATTHLIEQGIKDIAFLGGTPEISDYHERLSGFQSALSMHGIHCEQPRFTAPTTRQGGQTAFNRLIKKHKNIKAVVCFNDVIAYGVIEAMREHELVPGKDIKVVGFDDLQDSQLMKPALSSVRIDADDIGKRTCQTLAEVLSQSQPPVRTLVNVSLKVRESSLPSPQSQ